jgi:hypothetical protein
VGDMHRHCKFDDWLEHLQDIMMDQPIVLGRRDHPWNDDIQQFDLVYHCCKLLNNRSSLVYANEDMEEVNRVERKQVHCEYIHLDLLHASNNPNIEWFDSGIHRHIEHCILPMAEDTIVDSVEHCNQQY